MSECIDRQNVNWHELRQQIEAWASALGFQQLGVCDIDLQAHAPRLQQWLDEGRHGDMDYMARHGEKRWRPELLLPGTCRVISVRMDYDPSEALPTEQVMADQHKAVISRYALGRDYHKLMRKRLQRLAQQIQDAVGQMGYRAFVDSAPVMEKPLAEKAGLGWIGKHTNLINRRAGSWFFLGELLTDLPLPVDAPASEHCGSCRRCIDACPTGAITAPFQLDARLCISYLTIELRGSIPEPLRPMIGNRVYGCDDCQLVCPWNKFAQFSQEDDFQPRHDLDRAELIDLFAWDEATFLQRTEGSAIRRIGHDAWLRNLAVALGNAPTSPEVVAALQARSDHPSELVREHVHWALAQHSAT
jgi:epoxyqueuosine reductase